MGKKDRQPITTSRPDGTGWVVRNNNQSFLEELRRANGLPTDGVEKYNGDPLTEPSSVFSRHNSPDITAVLHVLKEVLQPK